MRVFCATHSCIFTSHHITSTCKQCIRFSILAMAIAKFCRGRPFLHLSWHPEVLCSCNSNLLETFPYFVRFSFLSSFDDRFRHPLIFFFQIQRVSKKCIYIYTYRETIHPIAILLLPFYRKTCGLPLFWTDTICGVKI